MIRIRRKPSPAMVLAILALIVAMAGGAYAAAVPKNSVGSKQLKKNAVKSGKIVNGAVTSNKIANSAVTSGKIADNAVTSGTIAGQAVTSGKFFLSVVANLNFPIILASDCGTLPVSTPGIAANDHVLVTPPPGWAPTFVIGGIPDPANNQVLVQACNNFSAGGGDADGNGGPVKVLVIR
jgi:hypothetical protein